MTGWTMSAACFADRCGGCGQDIEPGVTCCCPCHMAAAVEDALTTTREDTDHA